MRELYVKTEAATEPISMADAKTYLNYLGGDAGGESTIEYLITSARLRLENYTGRNFVEKTMILNIDEVHPRLELPFGPINEVVSIKIYDDDGVLDETLVADDDYYILGDFDKNIRFETFSGGGYMSIEYTAGYGDDTFDLPKAIRMALLRQVKYDFDNRGNPTADTITSEVRNMIDAYKCSYL